jgi:hypothetical protein
MLLFDRTGVGDRAWQIAIFSARSQWGAIELASPNEIVNHWECSACGSYWETTVPWRP